MTNPVTPTDVESRWRPLSATETVVASALLDDAWSLINRRIPTLTASLDDNRIPLSELVRVECAMVLRVLRNPDGLVQENVDDYMLRRSTAAESGELRLTVDEQEALTYQSGTSARSVRIQAP